MITKETIGKFGWAWSHEFFVQTDYGNFIYSDPDYPNGNNTLQPYPHSLRKFCQDRGLACVRDKGCHPIEKFCGPNVKILEQDNEKCFNDLINILKIAFVRGKDVEHPECKVLLELPLTETEYNHLRKLVQEK